MRLPTLRQWDQLTKRECRSVASQVATVVPETFEFLELQRHRCGTQRRWVAVYRFGKALFSLVPGGRVTLGMERAEVVVSAAMLRDLDETREREEWRNLPPMKRLLRQSLTPKRTLFVRPSPLPMSGSMPARPAAAHSFDGEMSILVAALRTMVREKPEIQCWNLQMRSV